MNSAYREIRTAQTRLESTFDRARGLPFEDLERRSDYARHLCVLVSGFLETAVVSAVVAYVGAVSHPRAAKLVERQLARTTNLNAERLAQLIGALDPDWETAFRDYLADERKAAIDSLVALRHQIAHGEHTGVTLVNVSDYYRSVDEVVDYLIGVLDHAAPGA